MYKPEFKITNSILRSIAKIEAAKEIIENAVLVPSWERKFREDARERTIFYSTKIEGNKLDFDESKKVAAGENIKSFRRRDIQEIINYREVINFIDKEKNAVINKEFLLKIHQIVMNKILPDNELGHFRTCEEVIINSSNDEIVAEPIEPEFIEGEIDQLFQWFENENEIHPVLNAGILCFEILRIHPFVDGNGRTARIIATYALYKSGYDIRKFFSLEEYYDNNLDEYHNAIQKSDDYDDLTYWLEFFSEGLAIELERVKEKVLKLSREKKIRSKIGQIALSERQMAIIDFIEEHGELKNREFDVVLPNVSDDTILRDLKDLIEKGIIKKSGRTKASVYKMI